MNTPANSPAVSRTDVALPAPVPAPAQPTVEWSNWARCESSFSLALVPHRAGVFVLAEELTDATGPESKRMLAVIHVADTDDLSRGVGRIFASGSALREKLLSSPCFMRYAHIEDPAQRSLITTALNRWLAESRASVPNPGAPKIATEPRAVAPPVVAGPQLASTPLVVHDIVRDIIQDSDLIDHDFGDELPASRPLESIVKTSSGNGSSGVSSDPAPTPDTSNATARGDSRPSATSGMKWRGPFPAGF